MSAVQRSKKGCWTCRLRRKKCSEGGFPCKDCEARSVFCHGYGPKPSWKDRGEKEREEAMRLQFQARRHQSQPANDMSRRRSAPSNPSSSSSDRATPDRQSIMMAEFSMINEPSQDTALKHFEFEFLDPLDSLPPLDLGTMAPNPATSHRQPGTNPVETAQIDMDLFFDLSVPDIELAPMSSMRTRFDDTRTNSPNQSENHLEIARYHPSVPDPKSQNMPNFPFAVVGAQHTQISEKEIELVVNYLWEMYTPLQKDLRRPPSTSQSSWILFLLIKSPTFYFASLSSSAYHSSRRQVGNSEARAVAFQDYREYRAKAVQSFRELSENTTGILGEILICGVQIARLEALSKNTESCLSYLGSAVQYFINHDDLFLSNLIPSPKVLHSPISPDFPTQQTSPSTLTPRPTPMQSKALSHFATLLLYNDIISSSASKKPTGAPEIYRKLFSNQSFTDSFQDITNCESWVLSAIMETSILEIWKRDQQSYSKLSVRELVNRAGKIEAILEKGISRLSNALRPNTPASNTPPSPANIATNINHHSSHTHIQTYIFAHAVLIELYVVVSGPRPDVPEINQTIDRAIAAWKMRPCSMSLKSLAWPYCVSASLASGLQRDFFRGVGLRGSLPDTALGNFDELKSVVDEECWREFDRRGSDCDTAADWKDVIQRSNLNLSFS